MKKVLFILFSMCFPVGSFAQTNTSNNEGDAIFKETVHDFGTIKESAEPVVYEFKYTNTGDKPLLITNARASCGCTVAEYTKEPTAPGKDFYVKVSYATRNRPGAFNKSINVSTNYGPKTLYVRGVVQ